MDPSMLPTSVPTTYVNRDGISAIGIIFPALTLIFFTLRASRWRKSSLEIDDYFIIPAAFLTIAAGVGMFIAARMNIIGGHSLPMITPEQYAKLGKFEYAFWICHVLAIGTIKMSILFLFRRLFKGRSKTTVFDIVNWALIVIVTLWTALFLFLEIFACRTHPELSWTSVSNLRGACLDAFAILCACAAISWAIDVAILVVPLFKIGSLNMKVKRKIQASLIFVFSIFAVVAGTLRMVIWIQVESQGIHKLSVSVLNSTIYSSDVEGVVSLIMFWTYIEIGVGFVIACLPPCVVLIDSFVQSSVKYMRSVYHTVVSSKSGNSKASKGSEVPYDSKNPRKPAHFDKDLELGSDYDSGRTPSTSEASDKHYTGLAPETTYNSSRGIVRQIDIETYNEQMPESQLRRDPLPPWATASPQGIAK